VGALLLGTDELTRDNRLGCLRGLISLVQQILANKAHRFPALLAADGVFDLFDLNVERLDRARRRRDAAASNTGTDAGWECACGWGGDYSSARIEYISNHPIEDIHMCASRAHCVAVRARAHVTCAAALAASAVASLRPTNPMS
jgi:hypothetical protein